MNIKDLLLYGKETEICPYYGSRAMIPISDMILCNYSYVIDYRVNEELMRHLDKNSVVLIDEAHNIDDVCVDSMSIRIDKYILYRSLENLNILSREYDKRKEENFDMFKKEYNKFISQAKEDS